jgi:hypothetical protein
MGYPLATGFGGVSMPETIAEWCRRTLAEGYKVKPQRMTPDERAAYLAWKEQDHAEKIASGWYERLEDPPGW